MLYKDELCDTIRRNAVTSLLYEVSATPKPGLVDRLNQGAHKDMDFFSFMASSAALSPFFYQCALKGTEFKENNLRLGILFEALRPVGLVAEKAMLMATGGVNTHKGLIFSLGTICAAAAVCYMKGKTEKPSTEEICDTVSLMTQGICTRELDSLEKKHDLTHGEKIYMKYGARGIRGEVENGFPTVRNCSLPVLTKMISLNRYSINDILVQTLLHLIAVNEDTNILARQDKDTLDYVRNYAGMALEAGGILTPEGREMVDKMDRDFIVKNISPGGSADLLAVTVMLDRLYRSSFQILFT